MTRKTKLWLALGGGAAIVLLAAFHPLSLAHSLRAFLSWIRALGPSGAFIYALVYSVGVLLLPALLLTAGAGLIYGPVIGSLVVSPASVLGATLAFLISRYLARDWVEGKIAGHPKVSAIHRAVEKNGFKMVLLLRLQPVVPFVLLNYALGLSRIRLRDYVLASWLGMLPATILYVYLGSALRSMDDLFHIRSKDAGGWGQLLFWGGLLAAVLLVWIVGRLGRRALQAELGEQKPQERGSV